MKKIKLSLFPLLLFSFQAQSQLNEDFEFGFGTNDWIRHSTYFVDGQIQLQWELQELPWSPIAGFGSAFIDRENIGAGNTAEYWLISKGLEIDDNDRLSFWGRQTISGDQGTLYEVRITNGDRTNYDGYNLLSSWTESEFSNSPSNDVEKHIPLTPYAGSMVYVAFVRRHTQISAPISGDRWMIDDVKIENIPLSTNNFQNLAIEIYPNPTHDSWNFKSKNELIDKIDIRDFTGKLVKSISYRSTSVTIDATTVESGIYLAEISIGDKISIIKLLKK